MKAQNERDSGINAHAVDVREVYRLFTLSIHYLIQALPCQCLLFPLLHRSCDVFGYLFLLRMLILIPYFLRGCLKSLSCPPIFSLIQSADYTTACPPRLLLVPLPRSILFISSSNAHALSFGSFATGEPYPGTGGPVLACCSGTFGGAGGPPPPL